MLQASTIRTRIIPYAFPSKPSDELFPCIYLLTYSSLPDCCPRNILASRTSMPSLWFVRYRLSCHVNFIPQQLNFRQNGEFRVHCVESSLGPLVLSSVHSTIIITNVLINQAESYYVITNFYLIWDRRQLYPITWMISLLLHFTLALPQSHVITTISSL